MSWPPTRTAYRVALTAALALCVALAAWLWLIAPDARALMLPPVAIDGSEDEIVDLGDVAMAEDGTGGLVYRRLVDGRPHVFAAIFRGGRWSPPVRVDIGQPFATSTPRIAAGLGGRLVVVWVQDGDESGDRLYSASLDPGAVMFEPPVPIDLAVGKRGNVAPDLAMNGAGQGYLVYRVITATSAENSSIPPGYALVSLRAARYNGWTWSRFDQQLNRNTAQPVNAPSRNNEPRVTIDRYGNGTIAFQEPDDEFVDRVWVRRLFGGTFGLPIITSPTSYGGRPLRAPADQIAVDGGPFGNLAVSFRQQPGNPSGLDRTRVFVNLLPDMFSNGAATMTGARPVDVAPGDGAPINGAVALSPSQQFHSIFALTGVQRADGSDATDPRVAQLGDAAIPVGPFAGADLAVGGRAVSAWVSGAAGQQVVRLREEDEAGNAIEGDTASLGRGEVPELLVAGSGYGDIIAAARQQSGTVTQILVAGADAPPSTFSVFEDEKWQRDRKPVVEWEPSYDVSGPLSYEVKLNRRLVGISGAASFGLGRAARDGRNSIVVTAIDTLGQRRDARTVRLLLDRRAPRVRVRRLAGRRVRVSVTDGRRGRTAGVSSRTLVYWGDGRRSRVRGTATHRYRRAGRLLVRVVARDRAGNKRVVKRRLRL